MVVVFLLGNAAGWYFNRAKQVEVQQQVTQRVNQLGGVYYYDYQLRPDGALAKDSELSWAGKLLGVDWWHDVFYITFAEFDTNEQGQTIATSRDGIKDDFLTLAAQLPALRWVALNGTGITDSGIEQLCRRREIEKLWLGQTSVSDRALQAVADCPSVNLLALEATNTSDAGIGYLAKLPDLETLSLGSPHLTPSGLEGLGEFESLVELRLDLLPVTDSVIERLSGLPNLQTLSISRTAISSDSGQSISKIKSLKWLNLDFTEIDQAFFQGMDLPELEELSVVGTQVDASGLESLSGSHNLKRLDARATQCKISVLCKFLESELGKSPEQALGSISDVALDDDGNLISLDLTGYLCTDEDLSVVDGHSQLQWLKLPGNALTAAGYQRLSKLDLPKLRLLDISQSRLTDEGLGYVLALKQLVNLHLTDTDVSPQKMEQASTTNPGLTIYRNKLVNY